MIQAKISFMPFTLCSKIQHLQHLTDKCVKSTSNLFNIYNLEISLTEVNMLLITQSFGVPQIFLVDMKQ